ncbi:DUF3488 and transglutaminase-like domain-containing protein [Ruania suaedae]|uniref:transglutaminase TgpA family protein n=1 Tax=Ruania suaedae TaxID=2897774 RepID=UPI001E2DF198|nr:transglutaminaseTgpA domain-containing protein [Ruania suaedae]UFU04220.1 DUF3488 and transglutaminase-like domain-containing protein [Ruania suaedae]
MIGLARTAAVAALILTSTATMSSLVAVSLWAPELVIVLVLVSAVLVALRSRTRRVLVPTLAALVLGTAVVHGWYSRQVAAVPGVPDADSIAYLDRLVREAIAHTQVVLPPITDQEGVGMLVVAGALLAFLLAELVAVGCRAPVWSMVPVLALWCVPVLLDARVGPVLLAANGAAFLAVLATSAAPQRAARATRADGPGGSGGRRRVPAWPIATGASLAVSLVLALVVAPSMAALPNPVRIHTPAELGQAQFTRLELGLDLRDDLLRRSEEEVITYTGMSPQELGPLHAYTMTEFDGSTWDRRREATDEVLPVEDERQLLWPEPVSRTSGESVTITVGDLRQDRLLLPGEPRTVSAPDGTSYDPGADELQVDRAEPGSSLTYEVTLHRRDLDPQLLRRSDPRAEQAEPELLELPGTGYAEDIGDLAREIVEDAGAETAYEEALALQNYLRDPAEFTYTESVTGVRTTDAVWDFLNDRRGYCVQFATTMVMLARSLDLPSRIAIGYLPGSGTDDGGAIGSHSAHAWPQIHFPGSGWVRFEPTPSQQTGTAPEWAPEQDEEQTEEPAEAQEPSAPPAEDPEEPAEETPEEDDPQAGAETPSGGARSADLQQWWALAAALVLSLGAAVASLWLGRRAALGRAGIEPAWRRTLVRLERAGVEVTAQSTPRAIAHAGHGVLDPAGARALEEFARAVEAERYGREQTQTPSEQITGWVRTIGAGLTPTR